MIVPDWCLKWVGLPYRDKGRGPDAWDCYGLCRAVLATEAGIALPDYADAYTSANDRLSVASAVDAGLSDGWAQVARPQALDLLILSVAGRPWHCGVLVNTAMFLHVPPPDRQGRQLLSCVERLDSPTWKNRVDGIYRRSVAH